MPHLSHIKWMLTSHIIFYILIFIMFCMYFSNSMKSFKGITFNKLIFKNWKW